MKKILFLSLFVLSSKILPAQFIFDLNKKTIEDIRKIEKENNSKRFKSDYEFLILDDNVAPPVIYRVKQLNLPDLLIYYYPYKETGKISEIDYSWDEANFNKNKQLKHKTPVELKPYILKYKELRDELSAKFGKGEEGGNLKDTSAFEGADLTASEKWLTDSITISLDLSLRSRPFSIGIFQALPGYFIRAVIEKSPDSKTERLDGSLTKEKTNHLDSLVRLFLNNLLNGNFDEAKKFLSSQNDQRLDILKATIKDDKWYLGDSGKQLLLPVAKMYDNLRYTRHGDTNTPPLELLSILLDKDEKIVTIQTLKKGTP